MARCLSLSGVSEVVVVVLVACIPSLGCHPADPFCALLMRSERGDPFQFLPVAFSPRWVCSLASALFLSFVQQVSASSWTTWVGKEAEIIIVGYRDGQGAMVQGV